MENERVLEWHEKKEREREKMGGGFGRVKG
jgi:hypothetical protein